MPSRIDRRWCLPPLLAALAACALPPQPEPGGAAPPAVPAPAPAPAAPPTPPAPAEPAPADAVAARLLAWQDRLRELPAAELAREIARREPPADAAAAVEQALALLHTRALSQAAGQPANGELVRTLALLEPVARQPSPWQATARLLVARVAEQRRTEELLDKLLQQLREQQRRNEQLAAQIEALRAIERSLGATRPPAPASPR